MDLSARKIPLSYIQVGKRLLHSNPVKVDHNKMEIQILPTLEDNYMYLVSFSSYFILLHKFLMTINSSKMLCTEFCTYVWQRVNMYWTKSPFQI